MGKEKKWYRVVDPLNPLCGADVLVGPSIQVFRPEDMEMERYFMVMGLRKVDVFIGDRPFQLMAKDGENLSLMISEVAITESPIQDEIVETGTDRPHGLCIDESEMTRGDGLTLRIARYEKATQIALEAEGELKATKTATDELRNVWEELIVNMFERGDDRDDIVYALRNN